MKKLKLHNRLYLAKQPCRATDGERTSKGKLTQCLDSWRVVKVNASETVRYGTMHCLAGHETKGVYATLFHGPKKVKR